MLAVVISAAILFKHYAKLWSKNAKSVVSFIKTKWIALEKVNKWEFDLKKRTYGWEHL